jgi:arylsulfatase A-like enzyme
MIRKKTVNMKHALSRRCELPGILALLLMPAAGLIMAGCQGRSGEPVPPNIVLIMADDMGYSDLGCCGGEIQTPNLDRLAADGLLYTQFYNGARCCPTRASLLTGLAPHQAGMGWMTIRDLGQEGYTGELNDHCRTMAEVLRTAGYSTYVCGKWHLTRDANARGEGSKDSWPLQRGFDRFFGTMLGAGSYYNPESLVRDNDPVEPGEGFFYTDAIGDNAVKFIEDHASARRRSPFFLYVAFTSPHWPLHARDSTIDKYMGVYDTGWDELRASRFRTMKKLGILNEAWDLSERDTAAVRWESLDREQKADMAGRMAVYAAQVDEMDHNIGKIIRTLSELGQIDNTLIVFLADNGGCAEFISRGEDKSTTALGSPGSFESYRLPWANASNTPFRRFKHWTHEGGIASPLIVYWPECLEETGSYRTDPACIQDIMPTFIEVADAVYPEEFRGSEIYPLEGLSLFPTFRGDSLNERLLFWEHEANRAVRQGKWKLVSAGSTQYPFTGPWELYDMEKDRSETYNLIEQYPELAEEMAGAWEQWAKTHLVYPLDGRDWETRLKEPVFDINKQ